MSSKLNVERLIVGPLSTNCYLVWENDRRIGAIIDPGEEAETILEAITKLDIKIKYIIATHCHFDHVAAVAPIKRKIDAEFLTHKADLSFIEEGKRSAYSWGFDIEQPPKPDRFITDGDKIKVGNIELVVLHTPGHSPGGLSFLHDNLVFSGDTLFQGSIGRTDFRMGSLEQLTKSIRIKLYTLPDNTIVHTGHGPSTTIGEEKKHNPFVRP